MNETLLAVDNTAPLPDQNKDYWKELTGPGGKFYDPDENVAKQKVSRGKYEADNLLEVIKKQHDELRTDYLKLREDNTAKAKLEELIGQLEAKQQQLASNNQPIVTEVKDKLPAFDPKQIESLVSSKIQEFETSKKEQDNFNLVKNKLTERYGSNYQTALKQQIDELELSESDINALARRSPTALIRTLGLDTPVQTETFQAPPRSNLRSDNFKPKGGEKRTWSYWQEVKRNDPKRYYDPKTNVQIHNDMMALGDEFKDGDYHAYGD